MISRQLSLEGSMRRWFGQYCYKKALTSCKNVPWLKLSWSEPPPGSAFSATHDWNWYWAYYQAASRALQSTGGTLAPERSLPRISARSGTNCDVTNLSRSSRSPVSRPRLVSRVRLLSAAVIIAATTPPSMCIQLQKRRAAFWSSYQLVSDPQSTVFQFQPPLRFVLPRRRLSLSVRYQWRRSGPLPSPPRSPANMTFSSDTWGIPWQIDQAITPYISDFDEIAYKWSST